MATDPPHGTPPKLPTERRLIGTASLAIAAILLVMIVVRGQQAAQEGNQELRNDAYAVLISPLAFAGVGLFLLKAPLRSSQRSKQRLQAPVPTGSGAAAGGRGPGTAPGSASPMPPAISRRTPEQELAAARASEQRIRATVESAEARAAQLEQQLEAMRAGSRDADQDQAFIAETKTELERKLAQAEDDLTQAHAAARAAEQRLHQESGQAAARITSLEQQLEQERQAGQEADRARQAIADASAEAETRLAQAQNELSHSREAVEAAERQLRLVNLQAESRISELEAQLEQKQRSLISLQTKLQELLQAARTDARAAGEQAMALRSRLDQLAGSLEGAIPAAAEGEPSHSAPETAQG